jgi:Spy/CpxP family protein refolding chaperone
MKNSLSSNIKRFLVAAGASAAISLSVAAFADFHGGRGCPPDVVMGGSVLPPHLCALSLTEAQQDKIFEIQHAQVPVMREKGKALRRAESDLRALTAGPDYSEAKARALADSAAKAMTEMTLARVKVDRQIFELLAPEQRKQLADMKPMEGGPLGRGDGPCPMAGEGRMAPGH